MALLPLDNLSESPEASRRYTQLLFDAIAGRRLVDLVPLADVDQVLNQHRVRRTEVIDSTVVRDLRTSLGAQFVMIGAILDFVESGGSPSGDCELSVTVRLASTTTGEVTWSCNDARSGRDGEGPFGWGIRMRVSELAVQSAEGIAEKLNDFINARKIR